MTTLSMLAVAKAAGVSSGAPYHHFADKPALLAALAEEGFDALREAVAHAARPASRAPARRVAAIAAAYVSFAATHPAHYAVMFLPEVADRARFASLHAKAGLALDLLVEPIRRARPDASEEALVHRAIAAWSTCHGYASLMRAGVLSNMPMIASLPRLARAVLRQVAETAVSHG